MISFSDFISTHGFKYLVVGKVVWENDPVAQEIAPAARSFTLDSNEYTIISLEPNVVDFIAQRIMDFGGDYELGFTLGNGKASFLTHSEALDLLSQAE